jgi:hypothetical protein
MLAAARRDSFSRDSLPVWDNPDGDHPDRERADVSVCIAATCKYEEKPCVVHCSDMAGTRAEIKSDDIQKIQSISGCTVLFAGDNSHARKLIDECFQVTDPYRAGSDEIAITKLKLSLNEAMKRRKRAISDAFLSSKFGLS